MSSNNPERMNSNMSTLLKSTGLQWPLSSHTIQGTLPELEIVETCVLLKSQWQPNKQRVKLSDFPDKTGFECFINHVHFPASSTKESQILIFGFVERLRQALIPHAKHRQFRVIVSQQKDAHWTVRFHQIRPHENWIDEDLEGYTSEAILVLDV